MIEESMTLWEEWSDFFMHLFSPEQLGVAGVAVIKVVFILILSYIVLKVSNRVIDTGFALRNLPENKQETLSKLLKSVVRYAVFFIAALTILMNVGLDPTPVLAGAGVAGLAIGFGAQNLVRDMITGFFVIFEDQFSVGDYVMINNSFEGTVEEMGLRVTQIREWSGKLIYIANGEITQITNFNREHMRPIVDVRVPYEADMFSVFDRLEQVCQQVGKIHEEHLIESPTVYGITDIKEGGIQLTIMAVSVPDMYWFMERQMRKSIIEAFHDTEIEIAYPRRVLYNSDQSMYARTVEGER